MLKRQYIGHLMWRADSLGKTLMLGKIEGRWRRVQERVRWLDGITDSMDINLGELQEIPKDREAWRAAVHAVAKRRIRLSDWTTTRNEEVPCPHSFILRCSLCWWAVSPSSQGLFLYWPSGFRDQYPYLSISTRFLHELISCFLCTFKLSGPVYRLDSFLSLSVYFSVWPLNSGVPQCLLLPWFLPWSFQSKGLHLLLKL